jgi:hypothetical protein
MKAAEEQVDYSKRHPATRHLLVWLRPNPKLDGIAQDVAQAIWATAEFMVKVLNDGPELSAGLRHLRESKDCFVIQGVEDAMKKEAAQK